MKVPANPDAPGLIGIAKLEVDHLAGRHLRVRQGPGGSGSHSKQPDVFLVSFGKHIPFPISSALRDLSLGPNGVGSDIRCSRKGCCGDSGYVDAIAWTPTLIRQRP